MTLNPEQTALVQMLLTRAGWLGLVILLDLVLGVTVAIKQHKFEWQRLADFLGHYGPQVITWLCLEALSLLPADLQAIAALGEGLGIGAYALILVSAVGSVLASAKEIGVLPALPGIAKAQK